MEQFLSSCLTAYLRTLRPDGHRMTLTLYRRPDIYFINDDPTDFPNRAISSIIRLESGVYGRGR